MSQDYGRNPAFDGKDEPKLLQKRVEFFFSGYYVFWFWLEGLQFFFLGIRSES